MIFIDGIIFSLQKSGGISVYFKELFSYLDKKKRSYKIAIYPNKNQFMELYDVNAQSRFSINIERFLRCRQNYACAEIFHSSYYRLPSKNFNGKVITTVHDFTDEIYPRNFRCKILSLQKRNAILNSDGLVCISENTKKDLLRFIPEAKSIPTRVIYNGVANFTPAANLSHFKPYVLFIGSRTGYKNFELCIKSLSAFKGLNLIIVGGGELSNAEYDFLNIYLKDRYSKKKYVDEKTLNDLYRYAFCLFYPSLYEGFGIPIIEAMKSGCPVIATDCSSISEIASGYAVLAKQASKEDFAACLELLFDDKVRNQLIIDGLNYAQKFSWNKCFDETVQFYDEIRGVK